MPSKYKRPTRVRKYVYTVTLPEKAAWPLCKSCGKPLKPAYEPLFSLSPSGDADIEWVYQGKHGYHGTNHFCSVKCGYNFGLYVAKRYIKQGA